MARIREFVSFVAILFCSGLFCAAENDSRDWISETDYEHFCAKVMSGHFEHIELVSNMWPGRSEAVELSKVVTLPSDEFALLYKFDKDDIATGYVIQRDSQTGNFIIYDFAHDRQSDSKGFWGTVLSIVTYPFKLVMSLFSSKSAKPEEGKVFYFIEKTDNPHELRLVHPSHAAINGYTVDHQLFRGDQLPDGFQHNSSQYLFDGSLGCVYVIQEFEFNLTQQFEGGKVEIRLKRLNIPYEQYFKCSDKNKLDDFAKQYRADRCDSVIGEDIGGSVHYHRAPVVKGMSTGLFWTLIGLACLFLIAMLVVGVVIFRKKTRKNGTKKRPIGPKDLESASKTLTTSVSTDAIGTTMRSAISLHRTKSKKAAKSKN